MNKVPLAPTAGLPPLNVLKPNYGWRGATGISSTAYDLYSFTAALLNGTLTNANMLSEAFKIRIRDSPTTGHRYGWRIVEDPVLRLNKNGQETDLGHTASIHIYPGENLIVVLLSNAKEDVTWETLGKVLSTVRR